MKNIITGTASSTSSLVPAYGLDFGVETMEEGIDCVSVVIQGVQDLKIIADDGSELIRDGDTIYRQNSDGSSTEVGSMWLLDNERLRYQYVLYPGEYQFVDIELDSSIQSEVLVLSLENDQYLSKTRYKNIEADEIQISIALGESRLIEKATLDEILPSQVATEQEIMELNASRGLND
jgi:hypothetical protein